MTLNTVSPSYVASNKPPADSGTVSQPVSVRSWNVTTTRLSFMRHIARSRTSKSTSWLCSHFEMWVVVGVGGLYAGNPITIAVVGCVSMSGYTAYEPAVLWTVNVVVEFQPRILPTIMSPFKLTYTLCTTTTSPTCCIRGIN